MGLVVGDCPDPDAVRVIFVLIAVLIALSYLLSTGTTALSVTLTATQTFGGVILGPFLGVRINFTAAGGGLAYARITARILA